MSGLWIRSQDKKHLLKCEALLIEGVGNNRFGIRAFTKNYDFDIANFETKQRALEILDEIQIKITEYLGTNVEVVYEMPEE